MPTSLNPRLAESASVEPSGIEEAIVMDTIWWIILAVLGAGAVGGLANALLSDNGFILPKYETTGGAGILRIGVLGNMFIGALAAGVSWGLYGPSANAAILGAQPEGTVTAPVVLTIATLFSAVLIGVGGSRWLTNEIDKGLLRAAASKAAGASASGAAAAQIATATPAQALRIATDLSS
jgi:hypothetical protein